MIIVWDVNPEREDRDLLQTDSIVYLSNFENIKYHIDKFSYEALIILATTEINSYMNNLYDLVKKIPVFIFSGIDKQSKNFLNLSFNLLGPSKKNKNYPINHQNNEPILWEDSLHYIENNLTDNSLSLEDVANNSYVSKWYYSKLFKEQFGITFKEFLIRRRIEKAKELIANNHSITDVCYMVGYGDLTHFGRIFKDRVGVTPSMYKELYSNELAI